MLIRDVFKLSFLSFGLLFFSCSVGNKGTQINESDKVVHEDSLTIGADTTLYKKMLNHSVEEKLLPKYKKSEKK